MRTIRDQRLHSLFFAGLALAEASCSTYTSAPPDTTPHRTATARGPIRDAAAIELAKQYRSADPKQALPGLEIVGLVTDPGLVGSQPSCSTLPCDPEWLKLAEMGGHRVLIIRRDGKLSALTEFNVAEVLGPLDTPEKVALRMQVEDYTQPATCGRLSSYGLACADGSSEEHMAVRAVEGAFEIVTFGERDVCDGNRHGNATALGVVKVSPKGELSEADNAISKAAAAEVLPEVDCYYPSRGRMFEGFQAAPLERSEIEYHLRAAREEAAAAVAFERLARELAHHGAPADLCEAARRSARDERRHARLFRREAMRVARAVGIALPAACEPAVSSALRSLEDVLLENAREGCANETYAALVATHQATHAPSRRLSAVFAAIAADERDHALLAYRIHRWGRTKLGVTERDACDRELAGACERLARDGSATPLASAMGEPPPALVREAFRAVSGELASAA